MSDVKKTKLAQGDDRAQKAVNVASPGRVREARKARDHGSIKNADGSLHSTPNSGHKPGRKSNTDGGNHDGI
jgi:hypothetical protein